MGRLDGRVAIVTGGGAGIGKGIARRLAAEGAAVVIAECNADPGRKTATAIESEIGARALALQVDVCDKAQVEQMVGTARDAFGHVDILVNNAWARRRDTSAFAPVEARPDADFDHAFRIGYMAALWAMQAVLRLADLCHVSGRCSGLVRLQCAPLRWGGPTPAYPQAAAEPRALCIARRELRLGLWSSKAGAPTPNPHLLRSARPRPGYLAISFR